MSKTKSKKELYYMHFNSLRVTNNAPEMLHITGCVNIIYRYLI